jgi:hypothetical protein
VEARLTDFSCETSVHPGARPHDTLTVQPAAEKDQPQTQLLVSIDRYLRAAGADEPALRGRLMAATARDLLAQGLIAGPAWAEIVAAIDRSLALELSTDGRTLPRARGRIALRLGSGAPEGSFAISGPDWGTPPRRRSAMPAQDLSLWRPSLAGLLNLRLSRATQGLAACFCWLAVLFVP